MRRKTVSGIMLTLLLIGMSILTFSIQPVKASGTIYIRADGSVDPDTAPISSVDNVTYTFTGNINDEIVIERDNIVVDGAGYTLQGTGALHSKGIDLSNRNNVTIKNMKIGGFQDGVYLSSSYDINILRNNVTANNQYGIYLYKSSNNNISGNYVANNLEGIYLRGNSNNNFLADNNATTNVARGIILLGSSNNILAENNAANNGEGIFLTASSNSNILTENNAANNWNGIYLYKSSNNTISGNNAGNNKHGIILFDSSNTNILVGNNATANDRTGIYLYMSSGNSIYHNNFVDNTKQVDGYDSINVWDDGYPSGGNYWSNYAGVDVKSGPNQDQPSSDGIGDTAYVIDADNRDRYPLMYPWGAPPPPSYNLTIYSSLTGVTFTVDGVSRATPWSGTYSEGSSVSLVMPETYVGYVWSHWLEDGDTNRIKTVIMDKDITLTAVYTTPKPVGGKATPINIPVNKPETPALWIWLSTIILAVSVAYIKYRKKQQSSSFVFLYSIERSFLKLKSLLAH